MPRKTLITPPADPLPGSVPRCAHREGLAVLARVQPEGLTLGLARARSAFLLSMSRLRFHSSWRPETEPETLEPTLFLEGQTLAGPQTLCRPTLRGVIVRRGVGRN